MFANLFKAEIYKIIGHRWATGCLVWIFPVATVVFGGLIFLTLALSENARIETAANPGLWTVTVQTPWDIVNNPFGRLLLLGFTGIMFAGEYQWNTWKSIVPRSQRVLLILTKFLAIAFFVVIALSLTSVILAVGYWLVVQSVGTDIQPTMSKEVLKDFAQDYLLQMASTFIATIISAGYVTLAAMLTRSILGSVLIGFGFTMVEGFLIIGLIVIAWFVDMEEIIHLYRFTPTYNLLNVSNWVYEGEAMRFEMGEGGQVVYDSLEFSLGVLLAWVSGLMTGTVILFQQQDITN